MHPILQRRLHLALALTGLTFLTSPAGAQFLEGPYIAGGAGMNLVPDSDLNLDGAAAFSLGRAGYSSSARVITNLGKDYKVRVVQQCTNSKGNLWYFTDAPYSDGWIYSGNLRNA